ncbi:MAG: hypothetical protein JSS93_00040 [Bacteroidetes bacterium]|nr:hypothetical protein [Bacteroidota bacterium]
MRRLYLETSAEETREIDQALLCDSELQAQYKELVALKNQLDGGQLNPSDSTVEAILRYSKRWQEHS